MKVSVLINNYNYQNYVIEAVNSVLSQTRPPEEIIVVDDGSTDLSPIKLQEHFSKHSTVKLILKENAGQLSCFNEGFKQSSGDIIFFLDSDDLYKPNYLENALSFYERFPECDFLMCDFERIGQATGRRADYKDDRNLGRSTIATLYRNRWLGAITTTLSARRNTLEKILPVPFVQEWVNDAENCMVYGSSIVGAHKFYCAQDLIQYRLHGKNYHFKCDGRVGHERRSRLFDFFMEKVNYPDDLYQQAGTEFKTIPKPLYKEFRLYLSIIKKSPLSALKKIRAMVPIVLHFLVNGDFSSNVPNWHL
ncbi:MAG: glycosyltransferase family 2 protein [Cyanobacteria bacterium J06554_6]